jgi:hypothetical protein
MTWSVIAALIWLVVANVIAMFPSRDHHWRNAYGLIAVGLPLLAWIFYENGPWWLLAFLAAAGSVLRWPLLYAWRWAKARLI